MEKRTINADLDELLFQNGNKEYGAYQIRRREDRNLFTAFLITGTLTLSLCLGVWAKQIFHKPEFASTQPSFDPTEKIAVIPVDIKDPNQKEEKEADEKPEPAKPEQEKPKGTDTQAFTSVTPSATADPNTSMTPVDSLENKNPSDQTANGDPNGILGEDPNGTGTKLVDPHSTPRRDSAISHVDPEKEWTDLTVTEVPVPQNLNDIKKQIGFPEMAKSQGMGGKAVFKVLVAKDGTVEKYQLMESSHPIFSKAVEPHLRKLTFTPGKIEKTPVKVWMIIPFKWVVQ